MPTFRFNKMIRDNMIAMYEAMGQKATYRTLKGKELIVATIQKIVEEAEEIPSDGDKQKVTKEIADVQQGIVDLQAHFGISDEEVERARIKKLTEKGGFARGVFVETLALSDNDEWVAYYRAEPGKYPELDAVKPVPVIEPGTYQHYKGKRYEVIGLSCHTETLEYFVTYKPLYDHQDQPDIWVRPYDMFTESVIVDGKTVPRFSKVD